MSHTAPRSDVIDILSHFDQENDADKTLLGQISQSPKRFYLTTLLVMVWSVVLLAVSPMLVATFPSPLTWGQAIQADALYSFQIPAAVLVAATLGQRYGTISILLYLLLGFFGVPVFAGGGGTQYFSEVSVGYLLGFIAVPLAIQYALTRAYADTGWFRGRSEWMALGALIGVVIIHTAGLMGIGVHALMGTLSWSQAGQWAMQLTVPTILFDFCFSWIAVTLVRMFRLLFWFCLY